MATMSIRGLDDRALARLKRQAEQEGSSVNGLVVRLLQGEGGQPKPNRKRKTFDDLDALAGTWSARQAAAFERSIAPFSNVAPELWA